jgi:hypothetical protein
MRRPRTRLFIDTAERQSEDWQNIQTFEAIGAEIVQSCADRGHVPIPKAVRDLRSM